MKSGEQKHSVFNNREQPVEIHLEGRILALGPRESAEVAETELNSQHLRTLQSLRLVEVQPVQVQRLATDASSTSQKSVATKKDEKASSPRRKH
jgi:hypothetical protein